MKHIIDNKIHNAIIIEDDVFIDFKRLKELFLNEFCYMVVFN